MEPMEKMAATWCARMPFWLGDNASHIAEEGGAYGVLASSADYNAVFCKYLGQVQD